MKTGRDAPGVVNSPQYLVMAKRWWWMLVLIPLLAAGSAYWFSLRQEPLYSASAMLFVSNASSSSSDVTAAKLLAKTYSELVTSRPVLERVIADLRLTRTVRQLESQIQTSVVRDTQIIKISAKDRDPRMAADIANTTGAAFVAWITDKQAATIGQNAGALDDSLDKTQADIERVAAELAALRDRSGSPADGDATRIAGAEELLRQYQARYASLLTLRQRTEFEPQSRVFLTDPAEPPQTPSDWHPLRNAALAFVLDLGLTILGIILFERLTDRVQMPADVHRNVELPVIGMIPRSRRRSEVEIVAAPDSIMSEAIRSLRAALQFAADNRRPRAIVITSPRSHEGKSVIAANLAVAFAQVGQHVVLIDGDLRRSRQHEIFGVPNLGGLSQLLADAPAPSEGVLANGSTFRRRRAAERRQKESFEHLLVDGPIPGLQLLVAGESPRNPSELLTDDRLAHLVADLKHTADVIVIDAPPLLAMSDTLLLAAAADHALIVAEAGQTRSNDLRTAIASIRQTRVNVLGIVLNGLRNNRFFQSYVPYTPVVDAEATRNHDGRTVTT